jgi:hypothetical protein
MAQQKETKIQKIINHYFQSKGLTLDQIKDQAKKRKIIYGRHARAAKELLELAGNVTQAKKSINRVAKWANSRSLDYTIETVVKKWLELDRLKPKKPVKKPFYDDLPLVWSKSKKRWYVISEDGEWKEFAGKEDEIEWKKE